ncbi:PspA/IM30 family protein [Elongatibacter sediminis]|uniref:PspA/IM30 family protein n=1 Tax=Elongatibacter sediminis TaxID=3119006 RepID=A0AAW9RCL0_9GAMM
MGTFSRMRYVIAANVNSLLEKAEDPEKLLRALIREMEDAGEEARAAGAELLAEQRHLERESRNLEQLAADWERRAEKAVAEDRDDLAREALLARSEVTSQQDGLARARVDVNERIASLEQDSATLKQKLADAKQRLKTLAQAPQSRGRPSTTGRPLSRPEQRLKRAFGRFDRLQAQVENLEARVQSYETGGPAPTVWSEPPAADPAIEEELARLRKRVAGPDGNTATSRESVPDAS